MENNKIRENTKRVGASTHPTLAKLTKSIFQVVCMVFLLNACQKTKPEIDRSPTCVPDKPVNWGEIYSQYMHKKFEKYVDEIWDADEWNNRNEPDWGLHDNIYDKSCKIIRPFWDKPKLGSKSCLPWKIKTYDTIDKVVEWRKTGKISVTFEHLVDEHWQGEAFDPRVENPFKPEWYNRDMDFAVIIRSGHWTNFYPKDCCQFITFDEMKQEIINRNRGEWKYDDKEQQYKNLYFRKTLAWVIDEDVGIHDNEEDINLLRYPLGTELPSNYEYKNYLNKKGYLIYKAMNNCGHATDFHIDIDLNE